MLELNTGKYQIFIANDDTYTAGSADNLHRYDKKYLLGESSYYPSSQHSITVKAGDLVVNSCLLISGGGATCVHEHSALIREDSCLIAVGAFMCSLHISSLALEWKAEVDDATCFGVYYSAKHNCFISHGELTLARVDHGGKVLWRSGGQDIFTNGFELLEDCIQVVDFNGEQYRFDIVTGKAK